MLSFYDVDADYADYLRSYDSRIPLIQYQDRDKFVCGIVLQINGCSYFAPVSSKVGHQQTAFKIKDKNGTLLSTIKFNFMFPAPLPSVTRKDISQIRSEDPAYADLLQKEYDYCKIHEKEIIEKANKVYAIGCKPNHFLNQFCCDFQMLEEKSKNYYLAISDQAFAESEKSSTEF